jgi:hypothetical protein
MIIGSGGRSIVIGGGGSGTGGIPIIDPTIISTITDASNWDDDGNYTGSTTGLVAGNYYYDDNWNQKYEFDGTTLRRISYNTLIQQ